jgi:hypothetical protein
VNAHIKKRKVPTKIKKDLPKKSKARKNSSQLMFNYFKNCPPNFWKFKLKICIGQGHTTPKKIIILEMISAIIQGKFVINQSFENFEEIF